MLWPIELTTETRSEPMSAARKLSTWNPGTNEAANMNKKALMTKMNKPKVIIVIGSVSIISIGFIMALRNPKTSAATIAAVMVSTCMPGRNCAMRIRAKALIRT